MTNGTLNVIDFETVNFVVKNFFRLNIRKDINDANLKQTPQIVKKDKFTKCRPKSCKGKQIQNWNYKTSNRQIIIGNWKQF